MCLFLFSVCFCKNRPKTETRLSCFAIVIRFFKTPALFSWIFRKIWWRKDKTEKTLYLTFDDGPIPDVTDFVLEELARYQAKATFFCVGENVIRHPAIAQKIKAHSHALGNHTHHHVKAWQTSLGKYLQEVEQCQQALEKAFGPSPQKKFFRPPHGQLTFSLLQKLNATYQVVMWSSLSYDFDATIAPEECLRRTISATKPGSIVVFHDSLKAERNLRFVLPRFLAHFSGLGYSFKHL